MDLEHDRPFYTLTGKEEHINPRAEHYWHYLTLDAYKVYERIYELCKDDQGLVHCK